MARRSKPKSKNFAASKTMQGLALSAAGMITPLLISQGVPATPENVASIIVGVAGLAWAAYGRIKADRPLRLGRK